MITLLDYGAGNVRSVINALERLGQSVKLVTCADDISNAERLIFPGVGAFGSMVHRLHEKGYFDPLKNYLLTDRPFLGICLGLQALFEKSEEAPDIEGLGVLKGSVGRFSNDLSVPQIGWNGVRIKKTSKLFNGFKGNEKFRRASGDIDGYVKILADKTTDEVLGVHMIGARCADLIAEAVTAMEFRASAEDISRYSHAHPTFAEAVKEAALAATDNRPLHV